MREPHLEVQLLNAALKGDYERCARLLEAGANPDAKSLRLGRAFHAPIEWPVFHNRPALVDLLLRSGADLHARLDDGRDYLVLACLHSAWDSVEVLLAHGADIYAEMPEPPCFLDYYPWLGTNFDRTKIVETKVPVGEGCMMTLRYLPNGDSLCPVCGAVTGPDDCYYRHKSKTTGELLYSPTHDICDDCGIQYGMYFDEDTRFATLREEWVSRTGLTPRTVELLKNLGLAARIEDGQVHFEQWPPETRGRSQA